MVSCFNMELLPGLAPSFEVYKTPTSLSMFEEHIINLSGIRVSFQCGIVVLSLLFEIITFKLI
jgi:hypothetical protein